MLKEPTSESDKDEHLVGLSGERRLRRKERSTKSRNDSLPLKMTVLERLYVQTSLGRRWILENYWFVEDVLFQVQNR